MGDAAMTEDEIAFGAAINILRDSIETGRRWILTGPGL